ncbi:MAG: diacylglycerol kinase family protein [Bacteriovorax sp.]|nr:diacylglycerol kinase family protein [Bacteriovorax sp.]
MKYLFLNPQSCSGLALKKWSKVKTLLPELSEAIIVDDFYQIDWNLFQIAEGDSFISAGGDGTLHCMVNALVKNKGIEILLMIKIGHIGLGSNNSFLRPYSECQIISDIPMRISDLTYAQDLMEIEVLNGQSTEHLYCVANSSIGFLATANILFNTSSDIAILKKWNSDLADVYTFIKALIMWKPIKIRYEIDQKSESRMITNMHFMKKPYYATDLGFPEVIDPANGRFRLNVLWERNPITILRKFFSMLVFKNLLQGRDMSAEIDQINISCDKAIPIEMDGEIYYGTDFKIKTYKEGIRLCK